MKDAILDFPSQLRKQKKIRLFWCVEWAWFIPRLISRRLLKRRSGWHTAVLGELDDHLLADIGLHRDEIMRIEQENRPTHESPG